MTRPVCPLLLQLREGCTGLVELLFRFLQFRVELLDLLLELAGQRLLVHQFV